jgi:hypothetical protein|tara:strand:- start:1088 stop:1315 length:228 start_codon:yes stop_codon:yes gene_type:complete
MDKEFKFYYETFSKWSIDRLTKHKNMLLENIKQREDKGETINYEIGFPVLKTFKTVINVIDYVLKERKPKENANV